MTSINNSSNSSSNSSNSMVASTTENVAWKTIPALSISLILQGANGVDNRIARYFDSNNYNLESILEYVIINKMVPQRVQRSIYLGLREVVGPIAIQRQELEGKIRNPKLKTVFAILYASVIEEIAFRVLIQQPLKIGLQTLSESVGLATFRAERIAIVISILVTTYFFTMAHR